MVRTIGFHHIVDDARGWHAGVDLRLGEAIGLIERRMGWRAVHARAGRAVISATISAMLSQRSISASRISKPKLKPRRLPRPRSSKMRRRRKRRRTERN